MREQDLQELIAKIYAAPLSEDGWHSTFDELNQVLGARWAQIYLQDFWSNGVPLSDLNPRNPEVLSDYIEHYAHLDPRLPFALRGDGRARGRAEMVDEREFKKSGLYNDLLMRVDAQQSMVLSLRGVAPGSNFLTIMRTEQDGPFEEEDCQLVTLLEPHLQQSLVLQQRMSTLDRIVRVQENVLEVLGQGLLLLGPNRRAVFVNNVAEECLAQNDGLFLDTDGRCRVTSSSDDRTLTYLIGQASETSHGEGFHPGGSLFVPRPSGKSSYHLRVVPMNYRHFDSGSAPVVVAILLTDPERHPTTSNNSVASRFGLTPAETRLVSSFQETASLKLSADALGITVGTARQHLKNIFQKTDTNSQVELMKLLISLNP